MRDGWTVGFVGTGVMGETMLAGLLAEGFDPARIVASHPRAERVAELAERHRVTTTTDNVAAARADVVVLAVKPQTLRPLLRELRGEVSEGALVVSIVAGARRNVMAKALGHARVVRSMPNLPCRIRQGMTVWCGFPGMEEPDRACVRSLLGVMGGEIEVHDESHLDRATAVSGTGPAIVAHFVKAWLEAAAYIGEPRPLARETVIQTLLGTAEMIRRSDAHVAELIDEVTSPGGTTTRALHELKKGMFSAVLTEAVNAAFERSRELGDQLEQAMEAELTRPSEGG
jgi:pyrroline-5-carboxylate reductase